MLTTQRFRSCREPVNVNAKILIAEGTVKTYLKIAGVGLAVALGCITLLGQAEKKAAPAAAPNPQQIERGKYVVMIGGCNDCHTAGYGEADAKTPEADRLKGDVLGFRGPWGTTYPSNLRLSLSKMTEDQWVKYAKGLKTRPPMPWFNLQAMTEADLRAAYQYIKSLGVSGTASPAYVPPDKTPKPPFVQWPGVK